jgi:hypothetical protein
VSLRHDGEVALASLSIDFFYSYWLADRSTGLRFGFDYSSQSDPRDRSVALATILQVLASVLVWYGREESRLGELAVESLNDH